jgi:glycosyltransferase involved in cell wall biosynthesis
MLKSKSMISNPLVSIVINNYNYDLFLKEAIDSALGQTYPNTEVIVVDDGSTDNSPAIISNYGNRIIPVLKSNGGQCSAINAGFAACRGEIICFLDSDDLFINEKVETLVNFFSTKNIINQPVIFHNSFEIIDAKSSLISDLTVNHIFSHWSFLSEIRGDRTFFGGEIYKVCSSVQVHKFISKYRYLPYIGMPTSSVSISRAMAKKIFPLPVVAEKIMADTFIVKAASIIGSIYSTDLNLTQYRIHGNNAFSTLSSKREKPREIEELLNKAQDKYLNVKLQEVGFKHISKESILSFMDSMSASGFCRRYYGYDSGDYLIKLAIKVVWWYTNFTTIIFFVETFSRGIYYKFFKSFTNSILNFNQGSKK